MPASKKPAPKAKKAAPKAKKAAHKAKKAAPKAKKAAPKRKPAHTKGGAEATTVGGRKERTLVDVQKEARKMGIPLSKDGVKKTKSRLMRAIAYRK